MDTNEPGEHDDEQDHPTTPLPWRAGLQQGATAPGMAVTDSMKAGERASRPSFLRRHTLAVGVAAAVVAVVVVAGGTAWGVAAAVATGNAAAPAAMDSAMHAKEGAAGTGTHAKGVVGALTAISGATWTMRTAAGATITVEIGSSTTYGTARKPADASSFAVGDRIGVLGARSGDTVTATRILHLAAAKHTGAGPTPTGTPTPTT